MIEAVRPDDSATPRDPADGVREQRRTPAESAAPMPARIVVHQDSRVLELAYEDGRNVRLPFEFLRVHSPSAEVRGHGRGQETLQVGKRNVGIVSIAPVGHYAIQPRFDDGHESGIYSWDYLYRLGVDHDALWAGYLERLARAGASRDPQPDAASAATRPASRPIARPRR
jgi:DUF971 family protein